MTPSAMPFDGDSLRSTYIMTTKLFPVAKKEKTITWLTFKST